MPWHGFLATGYVWRHVMTALAEAGFAVPVPDMRGHGDSDKPSGIEGYNVRALDGEFRALARQIGFGSGRPLTLFAHDMGAPPALLWAHPEEISSLYYLEVPVMLSEVLRTIFDYTPEAMKKGSMWWWLLPLAPGTPKRLIVGNERAYLTWFYEAASAHPGAVEPAAIDEYLRTFSGRKGVLGALGVYRAAFTTIDQTTPLRRNKVRVPVIALSGERAQGARIAEMVALVAENVEGGSVPDCVHFLPEERPDEIVRRVRLGSIQNTLVQTE
jgi:pimeloyl-ACP methyl ester carboxylesterase